MVCPNTSVSLPLRSPESYGWGLGQQQPEQTIPNKLWFLSWKGAESWHTALEQKVLMVYTALQQVESATGPNLGHCEDCTLHKGMGGGLLVKPLFG